MHKSLLVLAAVAALASCSPPAASTTTASSASSFVLGTLDATDTNIQGCTVMLSRAAENVGYVFIEDGVDVGAKGFLRIDGAILQLDLLTSEGDDRGGVRTFAKDGTQLVETWTAGAADEASDSVGRDATLAITRGGTTQTVRVVGGVAC